MKITVNNNRGNWRDVDWASYLGCPVEKVPEYRKIVFEEFETGIAQNTQTGKYFFEMYRYEITPSGFKRPLLMYSGNKEFVSEAEAIKDANENIISNPNFHLNDFWAKQMGIPAKAIQMLLIKTRV